MSNKQPVFLWVSSLPPKHAISEYQKKGFADMAGFVSQWNYIDAMEAIVGEGFYRISAIRVPGYPKYKDLLIRRTLSNHNVGIEDIEVGFLNIEHISLISSQIRIVKEAKRWAKHHKDKKIYVIMESLSSRYLAAGLAIKKICKDAVLCNIITDLPRFMNRSEISALKKFLKRIDWWYIKRLMKGVNKYALYTKYMADYLSLQPNQWTVIEGMANMEKLQSPSVEKYNEFTCTYAGNLVQSMKIENFIEAFLIADIPNSRFLIYGAGDSVDNIIEYEKKDKRIVYCGYIPNNEVFDALKRSTLLVHPRPNKDEYTRYSCPSKLFDYMSSGTACISTKLLGVPDEYDDYMFLFRGDSVEEMASALKEVAMLGRDAIDEKGKQAKQFMINEKSPGKQAIRFLDFLGYTNPNQEQLHE